MTSSSEALNELAATPKSDKSALLDALNASIGRKTQTAITQKTYLLENVKE